jgi:hypothetical protein
MGSGLCIVPGCSVLAIHRDVSICARHIRMLPEPLRARFHASPSNPQTRADAVAAILERTAVKHEDQT